MLFDVVLEQLQNKNNAPTSHSEFSSPKLPSTLQEKPTNHTTDEMLTNCPTVSSVTEETQLQPIAVLSPGLVTGRWKLGVDALKEWTGKTTTTIVFDRVVDE